MASTARGIGASLPRIGACASHCSTEVTEVPFTEHDDVIDTLSSDRTSQPFRISVLPRRSGRGRSISDAPGANTPKEHLAIGSIAIMDQVVRSLLPSAGLDQLAGNSFRGRVCCGP
jgi:hypothetical protein